MNFREMHQKDMTAIFAVRTSTRENRMTMEELKDRNITPESVSQILKKDVKGWVCEDQGDCMKKAHRLAK